MHPISSPIDSPAVKSSSNPDQGMYTAIRGNHFRYCATSRLQSSGRPVSEAAQCFRNLCVHKPSTLCKKSSNLRHSCTANTRSGKHSKCRRLSFLCRVFCCVYLSLIGLNWPAALWCFFWTRTAYSDMPAMLAADSQFSLCDMPVGLLQLVWLTCFCVISVAWGSLLFSFDSDRHVRLNRLPTMWCIHLLFIVAKSNSLPPMSCIHLVLFIVAKWKFIETHNQNLNLVSVL